MMAEMNIFVLSTDPQRAAQYQCDKHVVKMVLESAQILSTVSGGPYKPTHQNHPCVKWAAAHRDNYLWLAEHAKELCSEYTDRYGKIHKSEQIIDHLSAPPAFLSSGGSDFVQCMPDEFRCDNAVKAYRKSKADYCKYGGLDLLYALPGAKGE